MFDVGDLVVCVDAQPKKGLIGAIVPVHDLLREGQTYIVTGISYHGIQENHLTGERTTTFIPQGTVALAGVVLPPPMKGFASYRFRKVDPIDEPEGLEEQADQLIEA